MSKSMSKDLLCGKLPIRVIFSAIFVQKVSVFSFLFLIPFSLLSSSEMKYDNDTKLGFYWTAAKGNVHHYNVYISVNGVLPNPNEPPSYETLTPDAPTRENPYLIDGEAGKTYQIQVEAEDADGNTGLKSKWSDPVMCTPGDANYDGAVDIIDLILVARDWLSEDSPADIDDDGIVNSHDLTLIVNHFSLVYSSADEKDPNNTKTNLQDSKSRSLEVNVNPIPAVGTN